MSKYDYLFKISLYGTMHVGKSSILERYINNTFSPIYAPTLGGIDFIIKHISLNDKTIKLQLWHMSQNRFDNKIKNNFAFCSDIFIVVFDVSNIESFIKSIEFINECKIVLEANKYNSLIVLLGNKCDCENRIITKEEAKKQAEDLEIIYAETSAKTGYRINEIFEEIITKKIEQITTIKIEEKIIPKIEKKSKHSFCVIS